MNTWRYEKYVRLGGDRDKEGTADPAGRVALAVLAGDAIGQVQSTLHLSPDLAHPDFLSPSRDRGGLDLGRPLPGNRVPGARSISRNKGFR